MNKAHNYIVIVFFDSLKRSSENDTTLKGYPAFRIYLRLSFLLNFYQEYHFSRVKKSLFT